MSLIQVRQAELDIVFERIHLLHLRVIATLFTFQVVKRTIPVTMQTVNATLQTVEVTTPVKKATAMQKMARPHTMDTGTGNARTAKAAAGSPEPRSDPLGTVGCDM